jgi:hypothetical protein
MTSSGRPCARRLLPSHRDSTVVISTISVNSSAAPLDNSAVPVENLAPPASTLAQVALLRRRTTRSRW